MEEKELYPELADYIFSFLGEYFIPEEIKANWHFHAMLKSEGDMNSRVYKFFMKDEDVMKDEKVQQLINDGFTVFKQRLTERIWKEHKQELELNLCPRCGKIARTPQAMQCRFCFYDWH